MACRDLRISASTAVIQFSTAPSAATGVRKSNSSPSEDFMPTTVLLPRPNLSSAQLSKSLSMCSCTLVTSEVPRMDSSSSSEMKKKRGNELRFVSRYSDRDFWQRSSSSLSCFSWSRRPSVLQHSRMFVFFEVSVMIFSHVLSMRSKRFASSGSWWRMSSLPMKMLSRYIQFFCTFSHSSSVSLNRFSDFSTFSTSERMPDTKRDARMVVMVTMLSSSATCTSSMPPRMNTSFVSLYGSTPNSTSPHLVWTFARSSSSASSCVASVLTTAISSL
mmetsp:Transcript_2865/g.10123  ORF Transcript_2865/g.10123 Transcript_2865/m.10123 type:complete len:274 (+) Transcript_2865:848-1669(+)